VSIKVISALYHMHSLCVHSVNKRQLNSAGTHSKNMHGHISIKHKSQCIIIMHCTISNRYSDSHYLYLHHHRSRIQHIQSYLCSYNGAHRGRHRRWSVTNEWHNNHNELLNVAVLMHSCGAVVNFLFAILDVQISYLAADMLVLLGEP